MLQRGCLGIGHRGRIKETLIMKTLLKLVCAGSLLVLPMFLGTPDAAATKCATCSEQHKACISYCGSNQINFSCQNSSPCAGTCSCL
jgi:hypothetical protein